LNASKFWIAQFRAFDGIGRETLAFIHTHFNTITDVVVIAVFIAGATAFKTHAFGRTNPKITILIFQAFNASKNWRAKVITFQSNSIYAHAIVRACFFAGADIIVVALCIAGALPVCALTFRTACSKRTVLIVQTFNASENRITQFRTFQIIGLGTLAIVRACLYAGTNAVVVAVCIAGATTGKAYAFTAACSRRTVLICQAFYTSENWIA